MANTTKMRDKDEVLRWFDEGRPYSYMQQQYLEKYGEVTSRSYWYKLRIKFGYDRRNVRNQSLIPWSVREEHRHMHPIIMLRAIARQRAGKELPPKYQRQVDLFLERLREDDLVVRYEPDTFDGFFLVPRRPGIDTDLIYDPAVPDAETQGD